MGTLSWLFFAQSSLANPCRMYLCTLACPRGVLRPWSSLEASSWRGWCCWAILIYPLAQDCQQGFACSILSPAPLPEILVHQIADLKGIEKNSSGFTPYTHWGQHATSRWNNWSILPNLLSQIYLFRSRSGEYLNHHWLDWSTVTMQEFYHGDVIESMSMCWLIIFQLLYENKSSSNFAWFKINVLRVPSTRGLYPLVLQSEAKPKLMTVNRLDCFPSFLALILVQMHICSASYNSVLPIIVIE